MFWWWSMRVLSWMWILESCSSHCSEASHASPRLTVSQSWCGPAHTGRWRRQAQGQEAFGTQGWDFRLQSNSGWACPQLLVAAVSFTTPLTPFRGLFPSCFLKTLPTGCHSHCWSPGSTTPRTLKWSHPRLQHLSPAPLRTTPTSSP